MRRLNLFNLPIYDSSSFLSSSSSLCPTGYFTQISTLADVQENVMEYLHVLSRPKVIDREHDTVWTEAYIDSTVSWLCHLLRGAGLGRGPRIFCNRFMDFNISCFQIWIMSKLAFHTCNTQQKMVLVRWTFGLGEVWHLGSACRRQDVVQKVSFGNPSVHDAGS